MTIRAFNSIQGYSVGANPPQDIILANGDITTVNFTANGISDFGPISNVKITGGSPGQSIITDGNGNLTFSTTTANSAAPMPYYIPNGESYSIPNNFQGLFAQPIDIEGDLEIDGVLIEVSVGFNAYDTQVLFAENGDPTGNSGFVFNKLSGNLSIPGNASIDGDILPLVSNTYSIGSNSNRWNNLWLSGNTIYLGESVITETNGVLTLINPEGGQLEVFGNSAASDISVTGNVTAGNLLSSGNSILGNLSITGTLSAGDISVSSIANGTSNVDIVGIGGNVTTSVSGNANIVVVTGTGSNVNGYLSVSGNVSTLGIKTDNYYYANGQPLDFSMPGGSTNEIQFNNNGEFGASSNLTFNSSTNLLEVNGKISVTGDLALSSNSAISINNNKGTQGQVLTSDGSKTYWSTRFYYGDTPPDFSSLNYGDIFYYIDSANNFQRLYMWVTDGSSSYFYDFLPPSF